MRTKVGISMNGRSLCDLDDRIIVQSVRESKPQLKLTAVSVGGHVGQLVTSKERQYIDLVVEFAIAEKSDLMARAMILSQVSAWAAEGGTATVTYRPGQMLTVVCNDLCDIGYIKEWTTAYKLTLRAYGVPYWQSAKADTIGRISGNKRYIDVSGTEKTPLEFTLQTSSSATSVKVANEDGEYIEFTGFTLQSGSKFRVYHVNGFVLMADILYSNGETQDALMYRTAQSADELMLTPGENKLTVTIQEGSAISITAIGRWV